MVNLPGWHESSPCIAMMVLSALTIVRSQKQHQVRVQQVVAIRTVLITFMNTHPPVNRGSLNAL
jgi:hypothetical protein